MDEAEKMLGRKLTEMEKMIFARYGNDKRYKLGIDKNGNLTAIMI